MAPPEVDGLEQEIGRKHHYLLPATPFRFMACAKTAARKVARGWCETREQRF